MSYVHVRQFGTEPHTWLSTLDFYAEDISILDNRLLEVASKNTTSEAMVGVEHFQNQFIIQRNNITELRHRIEAMNKNAAADARGHAAHVGTDVIAEKDQLAGDVKTFETGINELRGEFNRFLSKWM